MASEVTVRFYDNGPPREDAERFWRALAEKTAAFADSDVLEVDVQEVGP